MVGRNLCIYRTIPTWSSVDLGMTRRKPDFHIFRLQGSSIFHLASVLLYIM